MQNQDGKVSKIGNIIPFFPRKSNQQNVSVATIATIIAVTILHNDDESPEDKLMELIESTGDVEILDALDATDELEIVGLEKKNFSLKPLNDN